MKLTLPIDLPKDVFERLNSVPITESIDVKKIFIDPETGRKYVKFEGYNIPFIG
jgi:hypothetical protein